ncbi:MAG: PspC domain-containing protein [Acidimicrobiia bacterium]|nr:PspC domain-containing protein [Acidimicrobiia bacterium]
MTAPARRTTKLYKDPIDKKIGGVASGVARYFDLDTTLVRVVWAVSIVAWGFGLLVYLVLWFILEDDPALLAGEPEPVSTGSPEPAAELNEAADEIDGETFEADL